MTVDYPDWMTEAQQMLAAYGGVTSQLQQLLTAAGMPLLHGYNELQTGQTITVAAAGQQFTGGNLQKIGYEISLACSIASAAATNPWIQVQLFWQDASQANTICTENWYIPLSSSGTTFVFGKGPSKGPHLGIK